MTSGGPLDRRFEAVVFDWDGTAVPDRAADGTAARRLVETLCALGMDVAVVSGTHVENVDGQLRARPDGPGRLHLLLNRGSEVYAVGSNGPRLVDRRRATATEEAALDEAAGRAADALRARGLAVEIVSARLNRRKLDLIPEPAWADPPKAQLGSLLEAVEARLAAAGLDGLPAAVREARAAALEAGLADPRVTSDAKHVEIGLTDKSDSARWILADLWRRGIAPGLVLLAGDEWGPLGGARGSDSFLLVGEAREATCVSVGPEPGGVPEGVVHLPGGPAAFLGLLADQRRLREKLAPPRVARVDGWVLEVQGLDPELERVHEALLTIADGMIGTTGSPLARTQAASPGVVAAGAYTADGPGTELVPGPVWTRLPLELEPGASLRRSLDLRTGIQVQELETSEGPVTASLFSSLARPGTVALRAEGPAGLLRPGAPLVEPGNAEPADVGRLDGALTIRTGSPGGGVTAAARERAIHVGDDRGRLERVGAYVVDSTGAPPAESAAQRLDEVEDEGYERLLVEHRAAWAARWEDGDVTLEGAPDLQLGIRFALFHLMGSAGAGGEAAVGARGLTGPGYGGHVFWDADVFVLPFLAATHPAAARAMLEYRVRRLPAARDAARRAGCAGARFPWESAQTGEDVTPPSARDLTGREVRILTGVEEEHITADVAWAASTYEAWSGDESFLAGPGRGLVLETARYWASRVRVDDEGRAHLDRVIGPDEYHVEVDDNAFTNVMARWNLRRAAALAAADPRGVEPGEPERWLGVAESLVDGYDPRTGVYEQFAGFHRLEPLLIAEVAPRRPVAADALLGSERTQGAQVAKQADVLMLHHLLPDEVAPDSLGPNLAFYEPRTAHGSSLSPAVHASLFARAGCLDEAVAALRLASRIDFDDLTGTTAGGLHLATMGSLWQAYAWGFAGLRPCGERLAVDPVLPPEWDALELRLRFRGSRVVVRVEKDALRLRADPQVEALVAGRPLLVPPAGLSLPRPSSS